MPSSRQSIHTERKTVVPKSQARHVFERAVPAYCAGTCPVPPHQLLLYYGQDTTVRRVDLLKATDNELEDLYRACQRVPVSRSRLNDKDPLDETYYPGGELGVTAFSTLFDPRSIGIHKHIEQSLPPNGVGCKFLMELDKLNVFGKGDFFKPRKRILHLGNLGSLVVVLPVRHEGGTCVLRHNSTEWTADLGWELATSDKPCIAYAAFTNSAEYESMPVTSGYQVTLTYHLYRRTLQYEPYTLLTPYHKDLKDALIELINDKKTLPNGGYVSFGLGHVYDYDESRSLNMLHYKLGGVDKVLAEVCEELGLDLELKVIYRRDGENGNGAANLLCGGRIHLEPRDGLETNATMLAEALSGQYIHAEVVNIIGKSLPDAESLEELGDFAYDPLTDLYEVQSATTLMLHSPFYAYEKGLMSGTYSGGVYMVIPVETGRIDHRTRRGRTSEEDEEAEE